MAAHTLSVEEIKRKLYPHFGYHLCDFQAKSIKAQLEDSDVVTIAATRARHDGCILRAFVLG